MEKRKRRELLLINERIHWAWLLMSLPIVAYAATLGHPWFACYLALANVPLNIYPILLQRDTRARLTRMQSGTRDRPSA